MEERQIENLQDELEFNDTFRFKDEPDESTPLDADNLNIALINTRLLKRLISDVINGKLDLVVKNIKSINEFDSERWYNELYTLNSESISRVTVDSIDYFKVRGYGLNSHHFMENEFKENTQYTFSLRVRQELESTSSWNFIIVYTDDTHTLVNFSSSLTEHLVTVKTTENKTVKYIGISVASGTKYALLRDIMINEGLENLEYSPYYKF